MHKIHLQLTTTALHLPRNDYVWTHPGIVERIWVDQCIIYSATKQWHTHLCACIKTEIKQMLQVIWHTPHNLPKDQQSC